MSWLVQPRHHQIWICSWKEGFSVLRASAWSTSWRRGRELFCTPKKQPVPTSYGPVKPIKEVFVRQLPVAAVYCFRFKNIRRGWTNVFLLFSQRLNLLFLFSPLDMPCRGCWSVELFRTSSKKSWASMKRKVARWISNCVESSRRRGRRTTKRLRCCTASEPLTAHSSWPAPPSETWCRIGERRVSCVTSTTDTCLLEDTPIDRQEDALTALYILQEVTL